MCMIADDQGMALNKAMPTEYNRCDRFGQACMYAACCAACSAHAAYIVQLDAGKSVQQATSASLCEQTHLYVESVALQARL